MHPATTTIGILVFEDFEPLDVWGPIGVFSISRFLGTDYAPLPDPCPFRIRLIANEDRNGRTAPPPVRSYNGPRVVPDLFRDDAEDIDVLMVPGGHGVDTLLEDEPALAALTAWLRVMDGRVAIMSSVCTGAALLARSVISRLAGRAVAEQTALSAEYDWQRDPETPVFHPEQAALP